MHLSHKFRVLLFAAACALIVLGGCASKQTEQPMPGAKVGSFMDDSYLTSAVKTKLLGDTGLKSFHVHVETENRVVTLSGTLPSASLRDEAIRIARSVDGVVKVVSDIDVKPDK